MKVDNILMKFGDKIVCNKINFKFNDKGIYIITGPNGIGKSTFMNIISGMIKPKEGDIFIDDEKVTDLRLLRKDKLHYVTQKEYLLEEKTVYENLEILDESDDKIIDILKKFDLIDIKNQLASTLSGGQRRRLVIARSLMKDYGIIILDEPTKGIDLYNSKKIIRIFQEIAKEKLVIIVTHDKYLTTISDEIYKYDSYGFEKISKDNTIFSSYEDKDKSEEKSSLEYKTISSKKKHSFNFILILISFITYLFLALNYTKTNIDESKIFVEKNLYAVANVREIIGYEYLLNENSIPSNEYKTTELLFSNNKKLKLEKMYIRNINDIDESDLVIGKMPQTKNEIVVDSGIFNKYYGEDRLLQYYGVNLKTLIGHKIRYNLNVYVISGITSNNKRYFYMDKDENIKSNLQGINLFTEDPDNNSNLKDYTQEEAEKYLFLNGGIFFIKLDEKHAKNLEGLGFYVKDLYESEKEKIVRDNEFFNTTVNVNIKKKESVHVRFLI